MSTTDERLETSIAGMVEAVILRRLADVQERAAAEIGRTLRPWRALGAFGLLVAAGVNRSFAATLDRGTSLAELTRAQGQTHCAVCTPDAQAVRDCR